LPKAAIAILAVALALLSGAVVFILFPIQRSEELHSTDGQNSSITKQYAESEVAKPRQDERNLTLRIGTAWDPKIDEVEKTVAIFIPIEDQSGLAGGVSIGCITEQRPHIFLNIIVTEKYRAIIASSERQLIKVSVPNEDYDFPLNGRYDDGVLRFRGYGGNISPEDEQRNWINRAYFMKGLFESFHRSKNLNFNMTNRTLSIRQSSNLVEGHKRMFEKVAAFCLDKVE
jgi:hypothetical protein